MNDRDYLSSGSVSDAQRARKPRVLSRGGRARAKAALVRQRIRTAEGLVRAFGKLKTVGGKVKRVGGKVKAVHGRVKSARGMKCPACDKRAAKGTKFCVVCGAELSSGLSAASAIKPQPEAAVRKPVLLQRIAAQLIDRLLPLPFLALVYPEWFWVVGAFHLICEMWSGRSPGKVICRMRVVDERSLKKCGPVRGLLRRVCVALGQVAYCRWEFVMFAVGYDLVSFLFVWRDRAGQRIEDLLLGTRVIGEGRYRKLKRQCAGCGAMMLARARFCPHCGKR